MPCISPPIPPTPTLPFPYTIPLPPVPPFPPAIPELCCQLPDLPIPPIIIPFPPNTLNPAAVIAIAAALDAQRAAFIAFIDSLPTLCPKV